MTYRDHQGDLPVPRIRIFRTQEQIDRALAAGCAWTVIGNGFASDDVLAIQNSPLGIENQWNYDEASGRTILVEVDAI